MTSFEVKVHLDDRHVAEIHRIGMLRYPSEACGVFLPTPRRYQLIESQVVEIPNRSLNAEIEYVMTPEDVRMAIEDWARAATSEERNAVSVWHTHPGGGIGPSKLDMARKLRGGTYLVVALTPEGPVPVWF